ncbi:hypothetical protein [Joostella sp. CR20]|uniref:hypothetical protein n=1 Tax=Joostella sp. CR20 TaxID=2804312 RepID=UPI00313E856F
MNAQGKVEIQVYTNVNKFSCTCEEASFVSEVNDASERVLKLPVSALKCPSKAMERDLRELFEADKYPYISLYLDENNSAYVASNKDDVKTLIKVKQKQNRYDFQISEHEEDGETYLKGKEKVSLLDFDIEPPTKALGMIKVKDSVLISFLIPAEKL